MSRRLLLALLVAACHHDAAAPATPGGGGSSTAPVAAAPKKPVSDLALLPIDSEAVIGVDFAQLQQSELWKQYVVPRIGTIPGLDKFHEVCGFDPLGPLKTITMGLSNLGDKATGRVVLHGYDRKQAMSCFDKNVGNAEKDGSKITIDGEVARVTSSDGQHVAFAFVDDATALVIIGPDAERLDKIQQIAAATDGGLEASAGFKELYGAIDTHQSMWLLVNGNSQAFQKSAPVGLHMKAFFGSMNVTSGLAADVRVRVGSPDEASNFTSMAKAQLDQLKSYFDKLDVVAEAADIHVSAAMTDAQIKQMLALFGAAAAGGGGDD